MEERIKKKPKEITQSGATVDFNASKDEIRKAMLQQENIAKAQENYNSKNKEFIEAEAFVNDAINIVMTRINRARAMVEEYWDKYLRYLKDNSVNMPCFETDEEIKSRIIKLLNLGGSEYEIL